MSGCAYPNKQPSHLLSCVSAKQNLDKQILKALQDEREKQSSAYSSSTSNSRNDRKMAEFTTSIEKRNRINMAVTKFIFESNYPPQLLDYPQFKALMQELRPSYKLLNRRSLLRKYKPMLLAEVTTQCREIISSSKFVVLGTDGWSNKKTVHFVNCSAITTPYRIPLIVDAVVIKSFTIRLRDLKDKLEKLSQLICAK